MSRRVPGACMMLALTACGGSAVPVASTPTTTMTTSTPETTVVSTPVETFHPEAKGWDLVWADEFDGPSLDLTRWDFEENCWGGGNNELQCYTNRSENVSVDSGALRIVAREESFTGLDGHEDTPDSSLGQTTLPYTSGRIRTKGQGDWKYGRIEVRARFPEGQGLWPAIWMLPTDSPYGDWAAGGEIDIAEAVNLKTIRGAENRWVHGTLHYGGVWPGNVFTGRSLPLDRDENPADVFHVYALEWEEGEIRWFVDDQHYATQTADGWYTEFPGYDGTMVIGDGAAPFDQKFHLLLNVAVGGNWPGPPDDKTTFPQEMLVDYVRVYECSTSPDDGKGCGSSSPEAVHVEGVVPSESVFAGTLTGTFDPSELNDAMPVFEDDRVYPWDLDVYTASGGVQLELIETDEAGHGNVIQATFDTDEAVLFFQSSSIYDLTDWSEGFVEFDLRLVETGSASSGFMMKVDCVFPCGTGDYPIDEPVVGEWVSYKIPIPDLLSHPVSSLDLSQVNTPLVVFPAWGDQRGAVLQVDNVRWTR